MDRSHHRNTVYYKLCVCLYAIGTLCYGKVYAQSAPSNTNIAGPSASATGNVTNQAVQVLQGPFAVNTYGSGVSCQGPTMSLSPFALGSFNGSKDPTTHQSIKAGISFHPDSPYHKICADVVVKYPSVKQAAAQ